ncbi:MAG TPA: inositol monophosphatase family protein [Campylobacterales bacterium]|nr:inositol monophosphatase family protein [Campylobacterales bacterium]
MNFFAACERSSKEFLQEVCKYSHDALTERFEVGEGGDRSIKADLLAEEIFVKNLASFGRIYSEESGYIGEGEYTIYLDPLDGSDNFASGIPYYGVSACLDDGVGKKSFICNFANGDIFYKDNTQEIRKNIFSDVVPQVQKNQSRVGIFEKAYANPQIAEAIFERNIKFRSPGALALSLVYSRGCSFALYVGKLRVFDIIAALDFLDGHYIYEKDDILLVSHDKKIFEEILEIVTSTQGRQSVL